MLDKIVLKTVLATAIIPTILSLSACSEIAPSRATQELDRGAMWIYYENEAQNQKNIEHNQKLLESENLEKVGEMNQGVVVKKNDGSPGYWVRDTKSHNLYPVKQSDGVWIMTIEGAGQRSLDKDKEPDRKKKQQQSYDSDGGEGGGEGGGGD